MPYVLNERGKRAEERLERLKNTRERRYGYGSVSTYTGANDRDRLDSQIDNIEFNFAIGEEESPYYTWVEPHARRGRPVRGHARRKR